MLGSMLPDIHHSAFIIHHFFMRVAVIGAGGWGTALSVLAARAGCEIRLWSRNAAVVEEINGRRVKGADLPSQEISAGVRAPCDPREAPPGPGVVGTGCPPHADT